MNATIAAAEAKDHIAATAAALMAMANGRMAVGLTAGVADRRTMAVGLTAGATAGRLVVAAMITVDHPMLTAARTAVATITNTTGKLGPSFRLTLPTV